MLRFVADEDFNGKIFRGLLRLPIGLDLVRVQDVGLRTAGDPAILAWAADEGRVVPSHDFETMTRYAYERVIRGEPMPGVVLVRRTVPLGEVIAEILLMAQCLSDEEVANRVLYVPPSPSAP